MKINIITMQNETEKIDFKIAIDLVAQELERAVSMYGGFSSPHEAFGILQEEFDELFDEIKARRATSKNAICEAAQIAAMAINYILIFGNKKDFNI